MNEYSVYDDINARTGGEVYMGVVGPVRTGKSTFIKQFMETLILPYINEENDKKIAIDELPQSANGKIIMTTEPKFIPKDAINIQVDNSINIKIRLIDCVGYMVEGALGHEEDDKERMVKTPWYDYEIPFVKAAEIGTNKVITEHSTIGIVVTTDGTIGEIPRSAYNEAEEKTINHMKAMKKPFVVILNSTKPYATETLKLATELEEKYGVKVIPISCLNMKKSDIENILKEIVIMFPIEQIEFSLPKWIETLDDNNSIKSDLSKRAWTILDKVNTMRDIQEFNATQEVYNSDDIDNNIEERFIEDIKLEEIDIKTGVVRYSITIYDTYYYRMISEMTGIEIEDEYSLVETLKYLSSKKEEFEKVSIAYNEVKNKGYGVVTPDIKEISIMDPEIVKHGSKYGIKIKAVAPSMHMLKADISTEIAPIVGSEQQANDLITYLQNSKINNPEGLWDTNIFGKTIRQLIDEGIHTKVNNMSEETREKMQDTLAKLLNDSKGGVICIII
ncbi:MAG: stage IV sporulation protein A [Lachnospiraceae bacterium]|nr:stage IV sporulation protein A [Lachnospiraceae bacterium]